MRRYRSQVALVAALFAAIPAVPGVAAGQGNAQVYLRTIPDLLRAFDVADSSFKLVERALTPPPVGARMMCPDRTDATIECSGRLPAVAPEVCRGAAVGHAHLIAQELRRRARHRPLTLEMLCGKTRKVRVTYDTRAFTVREWDGRTRTYYRAIDYLEAWQPNKL